MMIPEYAFRQSYVRVFKRFFKQYGNKDEKAYSSSKNNDNDDYKIVMTIMMKSRSA